MAFSMKAAASSRAAMAARVPRRAAVVVNARAGNWLPGSEAPAWLPDSIPGA